MLAIGCEPAGESAAGFFMGAELSKAVTGVGFRPLVFPGLHDSFFSGQFNEKAKGFKNASGERNIPLEIIEVPTAYL
jgi:hypothetical protein